MKKEDIEKATQECGVENLPDVTNYCSTGSTLMDVAIANRYPGGIPIGRTVHVYGGTSTCKSVLCATILGYAQRSGMLAFYADTEHTFDPAFATIYGLDSSKEDVFKLGHPENLEDLFDDWIFDILDLKDKRNRIACVDSLTALPSIAETKKDMKEGTYGNRAKQINLGIRKYLQDMANTNTTLFYVDQTRDDIGSPYPKETVSGGRALEFYSSVRIYLKNDTVIKNSSDKVIGMWVWFRIDKNKVGPPLREGRFRILFDYGLDNICSNLYFLSEEMFGEKEGQKLTAKLNLFDKEMTIKAWIPYIEENNLEKKLEELVWERWQVAYRTEDRKARIW